MFGPATRGPGARCERDPRHARRRAGAALSLLPLVIALGLSPWPAPAAPAAAPPSIDERLARERTHRLDDILQSIGELPEADRALRRAGRGSAERTQRITRLLALSGRGLGSVPESTAVAAGCLDLLTGDADLRESNLGARLASASDAAFQLLLADPPPLRSRTRELWQTWRAQNVSPDAWSLTTTRVLGSVVTPLPAAGPPAPTPRLLEGEPGGMPPLERGFDLPLEATVTWLPDGSGVLARGPDQVYRLRFDRDTAPVALGAQWPGAPLALAPAGDYAAGVSPAAGRDSLQALKLYRLADRVDAVVLDRGRRFVDLAWVANGTRLAALVDGSLRLYELAIARPKSRPLDLAPGRRPARVCAPPPMAGSWWWPSPRRTRMGPAPRNSCATSTRRTCARGRRRGRRARRAPRPRGFRRTRPSRHGGRASRSSRPPRLNPGVATWAPCSAPAASWR